MVNKKKIITNRLKNNSLFKIAFFQNVNKKFLKKSFFLKKGIDNGKGIVYKQFHRRDEV